MFLESSLAMIQIITMNILVVFHILPKLIQCKIFSFQYFYLILTNDLSQFHHLTLSIQPFLLNCQHKVVITQLLV